MKFHFGIPRVILPSMWLGLLLFLTSACTSPRMEREMQDRPRGAGYRLTNLSAVDLLPPDLRRVAVLPVFAQTHHALDQAPFEALYHGELRRAGRFELFIVSEQTLRGILSRDAVSLHESFPKELMDYLSARGIDGVLQLNVPEYRPYRPLVVGISARLFSLNSGSVLWKVDESFRASEKRTVASAREYALAHKTDRYPNNDSFAVLRGPLLFSEFVLHTIVTSLPPPSPD